MILAGTLTETSSPTSGSRSSSWRCGSARTSRTPSPISFATRSASAPQDLWLAWRKLEEELYPGSTSKEQLDGVERLINEFVAIDPTSQGFRYAKDTKGNPSLAGLTLVNVRSLRDVMAKIADQLEYYYTGLYGELDEKAEALRCMEEMIPTDDYE